MSSSRQELLIKLDKLAGDFLKAYAVKRLDQLESSEQIASLRKISFGEKKQSVKLDNRFKALQNWFEKTAPRLKKKSFGREMINTISECADKIGSYCAGDVDFDGQRSTLFDRKQAARVALMANAFLKETCESSGYEYSPMGMKLYRLPETAKLKAVELSAEKKYPNDRNLRPLIEKNDIKEKFRDSLKYQLDYLDQYRGTDIHLFTILDNLFHILENNSDTKINHLAGSMLYFMNINNYKTAPYMRWLKK